jgi:hypothetical protein
MASKLPESEAPSRTVFNVRTFLVVLALLAGTYVSESLLGQFEGDDPSGVSR